MQNPPSPEAVAKFRTYCKPPEELVKLLKDVGSCTVEIKMATMSPSRQNALNVDGKLVQRTSPVGMFRVQRDKTPGEGVLSPVAHSLHIII